MGCQGLNVAKGVPRRSRRLETRNNEHDHSERWEWDLRRRRFVSVLDNCTRWKTWWSADRAEQPNTSEPDVRWSRWWYSPHGCYGEILSFQRLSQRLAHSAIFAFLLWGEIISQVRTNGDIADLLPPLGFESLFVVPTSEPSSRGRQTFITVIGSSESYTVTLSCPGVYGRFQLYSIVIRLVAQSCVGKVRSWVWEYTVSGQMSSD